MKRKKKPKFKSGKKVKMKRMKRKTKSGKKMKRRNKKRQDINHPWGGHLPFPPLYCKRKEHIFMHQEVPWIDIGICINCKEYPNGCDRKKEYIEDERKRVKEHFKNKKGEKV